MKKCNHCGKPVPKGRSKFCSDKCRIDYYNQLKYTGKLCEHCGKTLTKGKSKFCSDECRFAYFKKLNRKSKVCETCGKELTGRKRKYCSNECRMIANGETEKVCKVCGKPLPKNKLTYCSEECGKKAHKEYMHEYHKKRVNKQKGKPKTRKPFPKKKEAPKEKNYLSFAEVCKRAREEGLSYGQCVARYNL